MKTLKKLWKRITGQTFGKIKFHILLEKTYWDGRSYDKEEGDMETVKFETIKEMENMIKEVDA